MSEHTKTFSPDLTRDTHTEPAPKAANQRQPTGLTPQALAILDHLNRHPDPSAVLSQWQAQDPALYAEALRAISATQGNSAVNQRVDAGAVAPVEGPSRTERARRGWSAEVSGKNKAAFASLFNALKPEAAAKPKLSEILTQSEPVPLPQRARLEAALCRDLSGVRAYQGPEVDAVLSARQAKGAAIGQHVLLGANPAFETVAEEVIHTCQQAPLCPDDLARVDDLPSSQPSDATEREAATLIQQLLADQPLDPIRERRALHFARQVPDSDQSAESGVSNNIQTVKELTDIIAQCKADADTCQALIGQKIKEAMSATALDDPVFDILIKYRENLEAMAIDRCAVSDDTSASSCVDHQNDMQVLDEQLMQKIRDEIETIHQIQRTCINIVVVPLEIKPFFRHSLYCGDPNKVIFDDMNGISDRKVNPQEIQASIQYLLKMTDIERALLLHVHAMANAVDNENNEVILNSLKMYDHYGQHLDRAATILNRGTYTAITCKNSEDYDETLWTSKPETEMENIFCKLTLNEGTSPSQAIEAIFQRPTEWKFDCAQYVQALNLYALKNSMGDKAFDEYVQRRFDGKLEFYQQNSPALLDQGQRVGYYRKSLNGPLTPNAAFLPPISSDKDALDQSPVGSRIMWTCEVLQRIEKILNVKDPYTNENVIKISHRDPAKGTENLYSAQFGTVQHPLTYDQIIEKYIGFCVKSIERHLKKIAESGTADAVGLSGVIEKAKDQMNDYVAHSIFLSELQFYTKPIVSTAEER